MPADTDEMFQILCHSIGNRRKPVKPGDFRNGIQGLSNNRELYSYKSCILGRRMLSAPAGAGTRQHSIRKCK